jgi:hypothetical protein
MVGYNVQVAVDTKHHLIVAHEVTNIGNDRAQLTKMATAAREAMDKPKLRAYADRGYFNAPQIKGCDDAGIVPFVPKPLTSNAKAEGRFDKRDFIYIAKDDEYQCPAGQRAIYRFTREENGQQIRRYWSSACPQCPMKAQCTPGDYRRISRWEHEAVLDAMQRRLDQQPEAMTLRRCTVEHVFGTLKHWMGSTHFLTRRLRNVGTEMSLQVLAYNLKRVLRILGMARTMKAVRSMGARAPCCLQQARLGRSTACVKAFRRHHNTVDRHAAFQRVASLMELCLLRSSHTASAGWRRSAPTCQPGICVPWTGPTARSPPPPLRRRDQNVGATYLVSNDTHSMINEAEIYR